METVQKLQRNFTKREVDGANKARRLYVMMGRLSCDTFEWTLKNGLILNNPITVMDYQKQSIFMVKP